MRKKFEANSAFFAQAKDAAGKGGNSMNFVLGASEEDAVDERFINKSNSGKPSAINSNQNKFV